MGVGAAGCDGLQHLVELFPLLQLADLAIPRRTVELRLRLQLAAPANPRGTVELNPRPQLAALAITCCSLQNGTSALIFAISSDKTERAKLLFEKGANLDLVGTVCESS